MNVYSKEVNLNGTYLNIKTMSPINICKEPFKDLFNVGEFEAILNLSKDDLINVVSHRKDAGQEVKNACRDMNNEGRSLYSSFIANVGKNIYPLIVATDVEPGFSGVGSTFTLFLADGRTKKIGLHFSS